jgi:hypothetical protein
MSVTRLLWPFLDQGTSEAVPTSRRALETRVLVCGDGFLCPDLPTAKAITMNGGALARAMTMNRGELSRWRLRESTGQ